MATKLIVTLKNKLSGKYPDFPTLEAAFNDLIASDIAKGLTTQLVYLDDPGMAVKFHFSPVTDVTDKACKDSFDQLYQGQNPPPDYLVIFGAEDVFPFQKLDNPLYTKDGDQDLNIPSDLPYACNTAYTTDSSAFTDMIRVVGRIPDFPLKADLAYVRGLLSDIKNAVPGSPSDYQEYFGIAAQKWQTASQLTMDSVFSDHSDLALSPPVTGGYTAAALRPRMHYYNCHGARGYQQFYGDLNGQHPPCLQVSDFKNMVTPGTVVTAECCYGAYLINSTIPDGPSIAGSYLSNHAIAFMGSTNMSYGWPPKTALADIICGNFMSAILNGASTGRALLDARQSLLKSAGTIPSSYVNKTLAQFCLLGDPSVQPVSPPESKALFTTIEDRRSDLINTGLNLGFTVARPQKISERKIKKHPTHIASLMRRLELQGFNHEMVFDVQRPASDAMITQYSFNIGPEGAPNQPTQFRVYQKATQSDAVRQVTALVVKEVNGRVLDAKVYQSL